MCATVSHRCWGICYRAVANPSDLCSNLTFSMRPDLTPTSAPLPLISVHQSPDGPFALCSSMCPLLRDRVICALGPPRPRQLVCELHGGKNFPLFDTNMTQVPTSAGHVMGTQ